MNELLIPQLNLCLDNGYFSFFTQEYPNIVSQAVSGIDEVWRLNSGRLLKWELTEQSSRRLLNALMESHV